MNIAELSELTGVTVRNIRRYITLGLLAPPLGRTRGAHYTSSHRTELLEIRALLETEPSLERAVKEMQERRAERTGTAGTDLLHGGSLFVTLPVESSVLFIFAKEQDIPKDQYPALLDEVRAALNRARKRGAKSSRKAPRAEDATQSEGVAT